LFEIEKNGIFFEKVPCALEQGLVRRECKDHSVAHQGTHLRRCPATRRI